MKGIFFEIDNIIDQIAGAGDQGKQDERLKRSKIGGETK